MTDDSPSSTTAHSAATLALAQKESVEHLEGLAEVYRAMRGRPWIIKAYPADTVLTTNKTKTVHLVRHGQGFHNLMADVYTAHGKTWIPSTHDPDNPYIRPEIRDAPLTDKGRQQASRVHEQLLLQTQSSTDGNNNNNSSDNSNLQLVVSSTHCRTLQTAVLAFASWIGRIPFVAHEMVRETAGVHTCDQRRPLSQQRLEFPQFDFDIEPNQSDEDALFDDHRRETKAEVADRIYRFLEWLVDRPETNVGISSHSGWLLTLCNGILDTAEHPNLRAWFQTGELRTVQLEFIPNPDAASSS